MKRIVLIILIALSLYASPAYAYDPPDQGSDNATDVVLWYGDNLTIEDIQGTISVDMTDVSTAVDNFTDTVEVESAAWISYTLLLFIVLVGFWKRLPILKFAGGIGLLATAFNLWTTSHILSIIVGVSGIVIAGVAFNKDKK